MSDDERLPDSAEELFEHAPCGYLSTLPDGTILRVNQTFAAWAGRPIDDLVGGCRFQELLDRGSRIFYETHVAPLLHVQGSASAIALDVLRGDGSRLATLVNAVLHREEGRPGVVRIIVFDATERRRYEQELVRARRHDQDIAQTLQQSLLSGELPASDDLVVDVAYRTAVAGTETGGDWFDAFWLDAGTTVALVVGDVVGRGIGAAATMGQLRSAVRALALTGLGPAALLERLDAFADRHRVGQMTTLVYAQVALDTRELRFASAGHPPIVVATPDGAPTFAWDGRSLPLDIASGRRPRAEATRVLAAGTVLVLYTDGLIERRHRPLQPGMDRLLSQVGAAAAVSPDMLVDAMLEDVAADERPDDVCVLTARVGAG